jgi:sarcosine oxidase
MPEIAVVGAGVVGLATAHALARAGRDVVVYEQYERGHTSGSSHGRSRIFRLAYPEVEWVRLAQEALEGWRELEAEAGRELLVLNGMLELMRDPATGSRRALEECGVDCRLLEPAEASKRFGVSPPEGMTILLQPDAGIVYADRALAAFARDVPVEERARVESLDELDADAVVVAAGPWARALLAGVGIDLPVVETCETVAYFRLDGNVPPVVAEIANGHGFYSLADPEYGLKVGHHKSGSRADPDEEQRPDEDVVRALAAWAAERFELAEREPAAVETCFYTSTADERFVLERHGRIVVGSACSGHGFKFAPAVGARLAALAVEALGSV